MPESVHVSELRVAMKSPTSPTTVYELETSSYSIASIGENISYTADQLDEKRENRRIYDYMCRLLEVRNWLVECLEMSDIAEVTDLETNLSNGVLLARLANFIDPDMVPLYKIFDLHQQQYEKEGQPCYRHTDNIMLWRGAVKAIRFPEVFLPETVDVYEGRNVKTIFCLYALAMFLFRLRRGPPIRNQAFNVSFSPKAMESMRQRLKDSTIPAFSDVGGTLSVAPPSKDLKTVTNFKTSVNDKDKLLAFLRSPDNGLLYVDENLIDEYQKVLIEYDGSLADGKDPSLHFIQKAINTVNEAEALKRLDDLIKEGREFDLGEMTAVLYDLQQEKVLEHAKPVYAELLYERRETEGKPLNKAQIENIIESVNICIRIKFCVQDEDSESLYEMLSQPVLGCQNLLEEERKDEYLFLLKNEYMDKDKDFILLNEQIKAIVAQAHGMAPLQITAKKVQYACRNNDEKLLEEALKNVDGYKVEFVPAYMVALKKANIQSTEDISETLKNVNCNVEDAVRRAQNLLSINVNLDKGKREEAGEIIAKTWRRLVRDDSMANYLILLEEELTTKKRKFLEEADGSGQKDQEDQADTYLGVDMHDGQLYLNTQDESIKFYKPEKINQWMLTDDDIQKIVVDENQRADEKKQGEEDDEREKKRKEEAAIKIQRWLKRNKSRRNLHEIKRSPAPSLRVVRAFILALVNSKEDAEKEAEIAENKSRVTKLMNANGRLNDELQTLDSKIALLVKNRMNLEEIMEHRDKVMKAVADEGISKKASFRKKEQDQWNGFEMIIYHLQMQPEYLSRIIDHYKEQDEVVLDIFKRAILPIFSFALEEREEYLFVSLIRHIIKAEIHSLQRPEDLRRTFAVTVTQLILRLLADKNVLNPKIAELSRQLEEKENSVGLFNLNVEDIFESVMERKPKTTEEAAENEVVQKTLEISKDFLAKWSRKFAEAVFSEAVQIPKMLRYLINSVKADLKEQFPQATEREITQAVGGWIYKSCYEGQIIDVVDKENMAKTEESREKRKAISKIIEYSALHIGYGKEKWYLSSLNDTITQINESIVKLLNNLLSENVTYDKDKYSDVWGKHQPSLHISLTHLNVLHRHLKENTSITFFARDLPLKNLVEETRTPSADQDIYITLFLHPIPTKAATSREEDLQEIFQRTKKQIVECLLCGCPGETIARMLERPTQEEEEKKYKELPHAENEDNWTLKEQKRQITTNLELLESAGLVDSRDHYQSIVTAIAKDINREQEYRREREDQLNRLRVTVTKLEEQRKDYCTRLEAYREYLEKCLENLSLTMRRPSIKPDSEKASKIIAQRRSLDAIQKVKCTAEKLDKKRILLSVDGCETFKEYSKMTVEIATTDRPGMLAITVNEPKRPSIHCDLNFQDLLQAEYREDHSIKVAGKLNLHVQKLIAFLNAKFYSK